MTDFTSVAIPKPKDWQALERHCRLLFELSFGDPAVQNNGRTGQKQHGVDIFGRRDGGKGRWVGIQCKGKDADYGGQVTEVELRAEVEKSAKFVPPIQEFILVTTAPNDEKILRAARLLADELRARGRELIIQIWSWDRVQSEINRFPAAIREFHPDATPFTDAILDAAEETRRLVAEGNATAVDRFAGLEQQLAQVIALLPPISSDVTNSTDALDKELHAEIDEYRALLRSDKPRTALGLLIRLKDRLGSYVSERVRYRLLSNIGVAHYNLGEYGLASDFLLDAALLNPDDPISLANKSAALLLKGCREEAHAVVVGALARYPDSQELALQRLQALTPGETVEDIWCSLSEAAKGAAIVFLFRLGALREAGDQSWHSLVKEGIRLYPNDVGLKILESESVIDRLLRNDPGAVGCVAENTPSQGEIRNAGTFLERTWQDSKGQEAPSKPLCGHNAALAWNILGETQRAANILDDIMGAGFDADDTKQLRTAIYRRQRNDVDAIRLADQLSDTPVHRIIRADLRIDIAPVDAREILKDRADFSNVSDIIASSLAVAESYIKEGNFDAALMEADRLAAVLPGHPQGPLAHFRVKKVRGDSDIQTDMDHAVQLVTEATEFPTRFLVAEAAASVQRNDDVVDLLEKYTSFQFDSIALRALVAAAVAADRRATLRKILNSLSDELTREPFYAKAKIALAIHVGSIAEAEKNIRAFLDRDPSNLELHIQLLHALFRQNKIEELKLATSIPADRFRGEAFDLIKLAHFKDDFGDWREAHALAYRTLLANASSQSVSMGYIGVFLRPGHSRQLSVDTPAVQRDTAVALKNEDGATVVYIIEPEAALRPSAQYLSPDHAVAKLLAGKKVGDAVEMPDRSNPTIVWVKPKVLHALHDLIENFNNRFPEAEGFEKVRIDTKNGNGLEPMFEKLRDRHEAVDQIGKLYESGAMTLSIVAKSLGCDPIEAMVGLASEGRMIRVCEGGHPEREKALEAIESNHAKGCVVDAATLHVIRRLKLERAVISVCGPIHIVDDTALRVQGRIHELSERIDESDTSVSYRDGQYFRTEVASEQKKEILRSLEEDRFWIATNTTIISADGSRDPSPEWRPLIERFGSSFLDEIRAAEGAGLMLLTEDQALRALGHADYVVAGAWLQVVLMRALERGVISENEYRDAVIAMIESRFNFVSISPQLLLSSVRGASGHALPSGFEKLVTRIGGKAAELESNVSVAYQTAVLVWCDRSLTETVRQAVVGSLLQRLIDERSLAEVRAIIYGWLQLESRRVRNSSMVAYIVGWLFGHFINLD